MTDEILLVDFENVQKVDLAKVGPGTQVLLFIGSAQSKLPRSLVKQAQPLGNRLEWIEIDGQGPNALDFHIAFYLGRELTRHPKAQFTILSRDKGFDPLVRHINAGGGHCERVTALVAASTPAATRSFGSPTTRSGAPTAARGVAPVPMDANLKRAVELLEKLSARSRPRKRNTLLSFLASRFQNKLSEAQVLRLVEQLFERGVVTEQGAGKPLTFAIVTAQ
jgi:hypothetical protein